MIAFLIVLYLRKRMVRSKKNYKTNNALCDDQATDCTSKYFYHGSLFFFARHLSMSVIGLSGEY